MFTDTLITLAGDGHYGGPYGDGPAFWPVFPIVWLLLVAGGVVTAIVLARRSRKAAPYREGEARLATLYAAGDISEEEYRTRLAVLRERR